MRKRILCIALAAIMLTACSSSKQSSGTDDSGAKQTKSEEVSSTEEIDSVKGEKKQFGGTIVGESTTIGSR